MNDSAFWSFGAAGGTWFLGGLLLLIVCGLSVYTMFRSGWRGSMVALEVFRILAAVLMFVTLLRPERVRLEKDEASPLVAVVMDASGSMETRDVALESGEVRSRAEAVTAQRAASFWTPLDEKYDVVVSDFALADRNQTDINAALADLSKKHKDLRAVLLLTDGDWNAGKSPVRAATQLRVREVPVFAVSVGSDRYLPDIELESVAAPAYGLLDEQISLPFSVRSRFDRETRVEVVLAGPDGIENRRTLTLPPMALIQESILLTPKFEGDFNYSIRIDPLAGEVLTDNNQQTFQMNFRREVLRVLVIESAPRWEYRFLHNALTRDPGVDADYLLFHPELGVGGGRNYLSEFPATKDTLSEYDVVFLGDVGVGEGQLTREQAEMLKGLVEQQGSGLVFLPGLWGHQVSIADHPLGDLNPVVVDVENPKGEGFNTPSRMALTTRGKDHLLTLLGDSGRANEEIWRSLPGFYWHASVLRARTESTVLAVHPTARSRQGRVPLLATKNCGNGKSLFLGTDGAWRWRRGVEDTYHYRFWGQVVRWMAHQRHLAHDDGMRFFFTPEAPTAGSKVFLHATVFDQSGFPVEGGEVVVSVMTPSGAREEFMLTAEEGGWGVFTGELSVPEGGDYQLELRCDAADRKVSSKLFVASTVREVVGRPARTQVLREIAEITGGRVAKLNGLEDVVNSLILLPERKPVEQRFRLWSQPLWAGLIVTLLAVYWSGRKWLGLI